VKRALNVKRAPAFVAAFAVEMGFESAAGVRIQPQAANLNPKGTDNVQR
jgi:hypothetical protein